MAQITDSIRFSPPVYESRTNSPSISPARHGRTRSHADPFYRNISPSFALRAFADDHSERPTGDADEEKLLLGIQAASESERALGLRVAKAAEKLRAWCAEIEHWGWAGSFEPSGTGRRHSMGRSKELTHTPPRAPNSVNGYHTDRSYGASLSPVQLEVYEDRIKAISDELETLDIEDLKENILGLHINGSRPASSYSQNSSSLVLLDDFSFLTTQTMLQSLPYLSILRESLDVWSVRTLVLRQTSRFLADLQQAEIAVQLGWDALSVPAGTNHSSVAADARRHAIRTIQNVLQDKVSTLGQQLDRMLDALEGYEDALPDRWIDRFEELETDYSRWVVEAQRHLLELEVGSAQVKSGAVVPVESSVSSQQPNAVDTTTHTTPPEGTSESWPPQLTPFEDGYSLSFGNSARNNSRYSPVTLHLEIPTPSDTDITPRPREMIVPPDELSPHLTSEEDEEDVEQQIAILRPALSVVRQASMASIGSFTRAQLKSIDVRRSGSFSSTYSTPGRLAVKVQDSHTPESPVSRRNSSRSLQLSDSLPTAEEEPFASYDILPNYRIAKPSSSDVDAKGPRRSGSFSSVSSSRSVAASNRLSIVEDSPSIRQVTNRPPVKAPRTPRSSVLAKQRNKENIDPKHASARLTDQHTNKDSVPINGSPRTSPPKSRNTGDELERQISNILTTIPAHIRLTSGADAAAHDPEPSKATPNGNRLAALRTPQSSTPAMTLAPAPTDDTPGRNRGTGGDTDTKLYHLSQPGKENKPIKLFVRRVGENGERVMVRVGGGWADLGEYLRQYVEHHGHRHVSESKFEVHGLLADGNASANTGPPRPPGSGFGGKGSTAKGGVGGEGAATPTPAPVSAMVMPSRITLVRGCSITANADVVVRSRASPTTATASNATTDSSSSNSSSQKSPESAPSTASSQRSWEGDEVGLAGPVVRKLDLGGKKLDWIEGMVEKARSVTAAAAATGGARREKGEKSEFGDLGRVGGTRRVWKMGAQQGAE